MYSWVSIKHCSQAWLFLKGHTAYEAEKQMAGPLECSTAKATSRDKGRLARQLALPGSGHVLSINQLLNTARLNLIMQGAVPADLKDLL